MNTPEKALSLARITAAERASAEALAQRRAASKALDTAVQVNGFGIVRDRQALRSILFESQAHITAALSALDIAGWPTDEDFDRL